LTTATFAYPQAAIGTKVKNIALKNASGKKYSIFDKEPVTVLFFFRPDARNSIESLKEIVRCEKAVQKKTVRCLGIVSDRHAPDEIETAIAEVGLTMPVLIDEGDVLFGSLKGKVRPTAVVIDQSQKIVAWQPFTKINFYVRITAWIRLALGEISNEELEQTLNPPKKERHLESDKINRRLNLAKILFANGKNGKAKEIVEEILKSNPALPAANALLDSILAEKQEDNIK